LTSNDALYRVREAPTSTTLTEFRDIGPPPIELATAGRMNPAGISYFYAGLEKNTALAEVLGRPPCRAVMGRFNPTKDLLVLDLTNLSGMPSIFDAAQAELREGLIFMRGFVAAISAPVSKNGSEHIDYVPSQIVCEYFSKVFKTKNGQRIDGIIYPSAIKPGGKNIVLFPPRDELETWESILELRDLSHHDFNQWPAFRPLT
jgi:RES domain-containing protein